MQIVDVPLDEIVSGPTITKHGDGSQQRLYATLDALEFWMPVVWNRRNGKLVDGEGRYEVAVQQGRESIPAIAVDLDEDDHRALSIALRARFGTRDMQGLSEALLQLANAGRDLEDTGLETPVLQKICGENPPKDKPIKTCGKCGAVL